MPLSRTKPRNSIEPTTSIRKVTGFIDCHDRDERYGCIGVCCFIVLVAITVIVLRAECFFGGSWCCDTPELVGDGNCHPLLMNQTICNNDGGDCCEKNTTGNRVCDHFNNSPLCSNYDGGDCRPPDIKEWPKCLHNPSLIADGTCDDHLKNEIGCNYDGGDCCDEYNLANAKCAGFNNFSTCENYDKGDCRPTSKTEWPECPFNPEYIGDGICFDHFKIKVECNHDGGDCCEQSLVANENCDEINNFPTCENYDKGACRPSSKTEWLNCPFNPDYIGDGICFDHFKTKAECNHDGDCCEE